MKSVLRALLEIFPQIDLRILRSVAFEFSKDADAAVEFIISDVLPIINEQVEAPYTLSVSDEEHTPHAVQQSLVEETAEARPSPYRDGDLQGKETEANRPSEPKTAEIETNLVAHEPHNDMN